MKNSILTIITIIITISNIKSQNLIPVGDHFLYENQYVDKNKVKDIMQNNPEAYDYFNKSQIQFKTAKVLGITSIVSLSSGLLITTVSLPFAVISEKAGESAVRGIGLILGGCVLGTIGIAKKSSAQRNRKKSLNLFNQQNSNYDGEEYSIDLSINGNGTGITYSF